VIGLSAQTRMAACSVLLLMLAGCGGGGGGGSGPPPGVDNNATSTVSLTGTVTAVVGSSQALTVTFASSDGNSLSQLSVTSSLSGLPAGWTAPSALTCPVVTTGGGCVLNLTYAPTASGSGTLTLNFGYTNNAGAAKTGSVSIPYAALTHDNVVGTPSDSGQINVVVGSGSRSVTIGFATDDGATATALSLTTSLTSLPSAWSSTVQSLACNQVGTGNGCQLVLNFTPTVVGPGTLVLNYSFVDNAGTPKTGSVTIPYAGTVHDNVVGNAAPSGNIAVAIGGHRDVNVVFNTDDGNIATTLAVTTDLKALPAGWNSSSNAFSCAKVGTANACRLALTYAPTVADSSTLTVNYSYLDNAGTAKTGSVVIPFAATVSDNVFGSVSPSGQVAVVTNGSQAVKVTFQTDDGNAATGLSVTTDLTMLPAGWTSAANTFACTTVTTGSGCQLALTYAPVAIAGSTLSLAFTYTDNAGTAKSGTVAISYLATAHNNVNGAASPAALSAAAGSSTPVTVTFTTDDGNAATGLSMLTDLAALPFGWSASSTSFSCSSVSTGAGCRLGLTYAPTAGAAGTLVLSYQYLDNAGSPKVGSATVDFRSAGQYFYFTNNFGDSVSYCELVEGGSLQNCKTTGSGFKSPFGIAFLGTHAYITSYANNMVSLCSVDPDGALSGCAPTATFAHNPIGITLNPTGTLAYVAVRQGGETASVCAVAADGTLSGCTSAGGGIIEIDDIKFVAGGSQAYVNSFTSGAISLCNIGAGGTFSSCAPAGPIGHPAYTLALNGGFLYASQDAFQAGALACTINGDGTISNCRSTGLGAAAEYILFNGAVAYLATSDGNQVAKCLLNSDSTITNCAVQAIHTNGPWGMAIH
jgi:hypothetical protein